MAEPTTTLAVRNADLVLRNETMRQLRLVLLQLDDQRAALVEADDIESLAAGAQDLDTIMGDLRAIERQVRADLARMIDDRAGQDYGVTRFEVNGVGMLESKGGWTRKGWRSADLLWLVIKQAIDSVESERIVNDDGEVIDTATSLTAEALYDALITVLPITASLSWRTGMSKPDGEVTGLKKFGINDEDWCEREEKPRLATIPRRDL